jgi:hypothetical protein
MKKLVVAIVGLGLTAGLVTPVLGADQNQKETKKNTGKKKAPKKKTEKKP